MYKYTYIYMGFYTLCHTDENFLLYKYEKGGNVQRIWFFVIYTSKNTYVGLKIKTPVTSVEDLFSWLSLKTTGLITTEISRCTEVGKGLTILSSTLRRYILFILFIAWAKLYKYSLFSAIYYRQQSTNSKFKYRTI